jgi:hypothetical protein
LEQQHANIELRRADDDPPAHDPEFREELGEFAKSLRLAGVTYSHQGEVEYLDP